MIPFWLSSWYNHAIMTTIRTFVAIELPANALAALTNLQNRLKTLAPPHTVRWSAPQNIHLTLHFLGDVDTGDVGRISSALETTAANFEPFALSLGNLGCFPNIKRPRVIWVGMQEKNQTLVDMQQALGEQLGKAIGFTPEKRAYSPHLTLGRVKKGVPSRHLGQLSEVIGQIQPAIDKLVDLPVEEVCLMQSELKPTGAVYTKLSQAALGKLSEG